MSILYWGQELQTFELCFKGRLTEFEGCSDIVHVSTVDEMRLCLVLKRAELSLVVLAPDSTNELAGLVTLCSLFSGLPVIAFLSAIDTDSCALVHRLHPRFVSTSAEDMEDAVAVARNIMRNGVEQR